TCCGRGTSRPSGRTSARTPRDGWPVSTEQPETPPRVADEQSRRDDPFTRRPGAVGSPPLHYGAPLAEQRALLEAHALVDLGDRDVVSVTGPDRLSWLDSLLSQHLADLAPGESAEALLLAPTGRVEHAHRVVDDGETTWILLDPGEGPSLAGFLDRMRFMLRVEVA